MREGSEAVSFEPIVASGPNPRCRTIIRVGE
jgi:hypothetical protein